MIRYLSIRNLAVIESAAVEFEQSFNVLTGETGAGKSILVEAVALLLGGRASQDLVRTGEDIATVEAVFEDRGQEITVRREITAQGRSRGFIDGNLATAAALRELAFRLVELHGQHEHQQLLDPSQHLPLLDAWAGHDGLCGAVARTFAEVTGLRQQLERLRMDSRERAARLELVEFQLRELTRAQLSQGEDESLANQRQVLRSAETIRRLCGESYAELYESDTSVLTGLGRVWKRVSELAAIDPRFAPYLEQRAALKAQLEDLALTVRDYAEAIDAAPSRLEEVEERLALVERLKRKYGPSLDDVIARRVTLEAEHAALTGDSSSAAAVQEELTRASDSFLHESRRLSAARREAATRLSRSLEQELAGLAMARSRIELRVTTSEDEHNWSERGIDAAEFYLSPNVGEEVRPLARIVSGGELSRVMLALKTLAAADQPGKTLIFDEVDAGIGGQVATVVGEKLRALGERFQVLCITHLPQIAAAGATHYAIEKQVRGGRTQTSITRLAPEARVGEIARMIAGSATDAAAAASAEALLRRHVNRPPAEAAPASSHTTAAATRKKTTRR